MKRRRRLLNARASVHACVLQTSVGAHTLRYTRKREWEEISRDVTLSRPSPRGQSGTDRKPAPWNNAVLPPDYALSPS